MSELRKELAGQQQAFIALKTAEETAERVLSGRIPEITRLAAAHMSDFEGQYAMEHTVLVGYLYGAMLARRLEILEGKAGAIDEEYIAKVRQAIARRADS